MYQGSESAQWQADTVQDFLICTCSAIAHQVDGCDRKVSFG
jgi:hypothetical protein